MRDSEMSFCEVSAIGDDGLLDKLFLDPEEICSISELPEPMGNGSLITLRNGHTITVDEYPKVVAFRASLALEARRGKTRE